MISGGRVDEVTRAITRGPVPITTFFSPPRRNEHRGMLSALRSIWHGQRIMNPLIAVVGATGTGKSKVMAPSAARTSSGHNN